MMRQSIQRMFNYLYLEKSDRMHDKCVPAIKALQSHTYSLEHLHTMYKTKGMAYTLFHFPSGIY